VCRARQIFPRRKLLGDAVQEMFAFMRAYGVHLGCFNFFVGIREQRADQEISLFYIQIK
jgi:hypothetical protein